MSDPEAGSGDKRLSVVVIIVVVKDPSTMTFLKSSVGMWHRSVTGKGGGTVGKRTVLERKAYTPFFRRQKK